MLGDRAHASRGIPAEHGGADQPGIHTVKIGIGIGFVREDVGLAGEAVLVVVLVPHGGLAPGIRAGIAGLQPSGEVVLVVMHLPGGVVMGDSQRAAGVVLVPQQVALVLRRFLHQPQLPVFVVAVVPRVPVAVGCLFQQPAVRPVGVADELADGGPVLDRYRLLVPQRVVGERVLEPVVGDAGKPALAVVGVGIGRVPAARSRHPPRAVVGVADRVPLRVGGAVHQSAQMPDGGGGQLPALIVHPVHIVRAVVVRLLRLEVWLGGIQHAAGVQRPHLRFVDPAHRVVAVPEPDPRLVRPRRHQPVLVRRVVGVAVALAQRLVGHGKQFVRFVVFVGLSVLRVVARRFQIAGRIVIVVRRPRGVEVQAQVVEPYPVRVSVVDRIERDRIDHHVLFGLHRLGYELFPRRVRIKGHDLVFAIPVCIEYAQVQREIPGIGDGDRPAGLIAGGHRRSPRLPADAEAQVRLVDVNALGYPPVFILVPHDVGAVEAVRQVNDIARPAAHRPVAGRVEGRVGQQVVVAGDHRVFQLEAVEVCRPRRVGDAAVHRYPVGPRRHLEGHGHPVPAVRRGVLGDPLPQHVRPRPHQSARFGVFPERRVDPRAASFGGRFDAAHLHIRRQGAPAPRRHAGVVLAVAARARRLRFRYPQRIFPQVYVGGLQPHRLRRPAPVGGDPVGRPAFDVVVLDIVPPDRLGRAGARHLVPQRLVALRGFVGVGAAAVRRHHAGELPDVREHPRLGRPVGGRIPRPPGVGRDGRGVVRPVGDGHRPAGRCAVVQLRHLHHTVPLRRILGVVLVGVLHAGSVRVQHLAQAVAAVVAIARPRPVRPRDFAQVFPVILTLFSFNPLNFFTLYR